MKIQCVNLWLILFILLSFTPLLPEVSSQSQQFPILKSAFNRYLQNPESPSPTGIASYGLQDNAGVLSPYEIRTNRVEARAEINSLAAYHSSLPSNQHGANLQLNVILEVNTDSGTQDIWLQNTVQFNTQRFLMNALNNIWNDTTQTARIIATGSGKINTSQEDGREFYAYGGPQMDYLFPLCLTLTISIDSSANGVQVSFYNDLGSGLYDKALLPIPNVKSATILVTPFKVIDWIGSPIDAELVWGGYCCRYTTNFNQMDSSLSMLYYDSQGKPTPFPSLYTFGSETGEMATNLVVSPLKNGANVVIGTHNNSLLNPQQPSTLANRPSLTSVELDYLTSKYGGLLSTTGVLLFSIDLATLSTPCGLFASREFMIGYCYVNNFGVNGVVWNYVSGPRGVGMMILLDYPNAAGTWHYLKGAPQLYEATTDRLPAKMNGVYGHAYVFVQAPTRCFLIH